MRQTVPVPVVPLSVQRRMDRRIALPHVGGGFKTSTDVEFGARESTVPSTQHLPCVGQDQTSDSRLLEIDEFRRALAYHHRLPM